MAICGENSPITGGFSSLKANNLELQCLKWHNAVLWMCWTIILRSNTRSISDEKYQLEQAKCWILIFIQQSIVHNVKQLIKFILSHYSTVDKLCLQIGLNNTDHIWEHRISAGSSQDNPFSVQTQQTGSLERGFHQQILMGKAIFHEYDKKDISFLKRFEETKSKAVTADWCNVSGGTDAKFFLHILIGWDAKIFFSSASHMVPGPHIENVLCYPWTKVPGVNLKNNYQLS